MRDLIARAEAHVEAWPTVYGTDRMNIAIIRELIAELRRVPRDVNGVYAAIPCLPITAETADGATDAFILFCIDFHEMIDSDGRLVPERGEGG